MVTSTRAATRILFWLALIAGLSFWAGRDLPIDRGLWVIWKAACLALLALWAVLMVRGPRRWPIIAVLALGTIGDVLLETHGVVIGGIAFFAGHLIAIGLYRSRPREGRFPVPALIAVVIPLIAFALTRDMGATVYAVGLGGMAGSAWASDFPRAETGLGALMFAASDLLIFAQMGPLAGSIVPVILIWPLYFLGQALIAHGVVTTLRSEHAHLHDRL